MKWSLRRSASRRAASACFRSVMSRATFDTPTIRPARVADGGDRQGDVDPPALLRHADGLEVLDPLPAADSLQDRALLVFPFRRDDQVDQPADGLVGCVAEDPLGPRIPREDSSVQLSC